MHTGSLYLFYDKLSLEGVVMYSCKECNTTFTRGDNLKRHEKLHCTTTSDYYATAVNNNQKNIDLSGQEPLKQNRQSVEEAISNEIPTFDGAEFNGEQPVPRETLLKMMEMVDIPEDRREHIAREEEKKFHDDHEIDVSSEVLEPLELEEMKKDFQQLYAALKKSKIRENVPKLIDILNVWREAGEVNAEIYRLTLQKIKEI